MEPRLGVKHTITCRHLVEELEKCHKASFWARFNNACDPTRLLLEQCLRAEYQQRRKDNLNASQRRMRYIQEQENK